MDDLIFRWEAIEEINRFRGYLDEDMLCRLSTALARLPAAQQWIPVTEKLPVKRTWVLCKCRANIHEVLSWRDGEWYHDPQHRYLGSFVTHWRELPEPPKEEGK